MTQNEILSAIQEFEPKEGQSVNAKFIYNLHDCIISLRYNRDNWNTIMTLFEFIRDFKNFIWNTNFVLQQTIVEVVKEYVANKKTKQPDNINEYVDVIKYVLEGIKADQFQKFLYR